MEESQSVNSDDMDATLSRKTKYIQDAEYTESKDFQEIYHQNKYEKHEKNISPELVKSRSEIKSSANNIIQIDLKNLSDKNVIFNDQTAQNKLYNSKVEYVNSNQKKVNKMDRNKGFTQVFKQFFGNLKSTFRFGGQNAMEKLSSDSAINKTVTNLRAKRNASKDSFTQQAGKDMLKQMNQ